MHGDHAGLGRFPAQRVEGLVHLGLFRIAQRLHAALVLLAGKGCGDGRGQLVQQRVHGVPETPAFTGRQTDRAGTAGLVEIGHIQPVVGAGHGRGPLPQMLQHQAVLANAGGAADEEVVALLLNAQGRVHGPHGPLLAEHAGKGIGLVAAPVGYPRRIDALIELFGFQGLGSVHAGGSVSVRLARRIRPARRQIICPSAGQAQSCEET